MAADLRTTLLTLPLHLTIFHQERRHLREDQEELHQHQVQDQMQPGTSSSPDTITFTN
jgi:hypothetical protein